MTHDSGFHMKDKNWRKAFSDFSSSCGQGQRAVRVNVDLRAYLVGTENAESALSLSLGETVLVTLEQRHDIRHRDVLDIDLVLVVQI
jgi:hypothetical protein